jgi:carbamoyl-phosphate synthase large subunit
VKCRAFSPGFHLADDWSVVPYSCEDHYISELLEISKKNNIDIIIPTVDEELRICSENKILFQQYGITIIVSDPDTLDNCLDKYKFYEKLNAANISVAKTWLLNDTLNIQQIPFPVIAKPVTGRGGRGIILVHTREELEKLGKERENYIIQEYAEGIEYSVDTLSDFSGKAIVAVPRKRLEVKGGVCWRGCIDQSQAIISESMRTVEELGIIGPACLQLILTKQGEIKIFELNPRIGGTISLTIQAGVDILDLTIKLWKNESISENELIFKKLYVARYFEEVFFDIE